MNLNAVTRMQWLLLLLVSVASAFFVNLWGYFLFDLDEGAFSEATREMLASGNYAATYLDGEPRYDKPILSYWFQAISIQVFGLNEFAVRLPSAIAATLWVAVVIRFFKQLVRQHRALLAGLILVNFLWVAIIGRAAIADAWLNLFLTLTLLDMYRYYTQQQKTVLLRVYLWMALGVLTKGPVALAIPLLTSLLFWLSERRFRNWLSACLQPLGWLLFLLILSPWLYLVYQDQGAEFFQGFIVEHNLKRFSDTREGHGGSWLYYFIALPFIILPFTGGIAGLIRHCRAIWRRPLERFLLLWFLVVFVLVSLSKTQLPHYLVYGITPLAIMFARHDKVFFKSRYHLVFPLLFIGLVALFPWIVDYAMTKADERYLSDLLSRGDQVFAWPFYVTSIAAIVFIAYLFFFSKKTVTTRLIMAGICQTTLVFSVMVDAVSELQQGPVYRAAQFAKNNVSQPIYAYKIDMPSFSFYREAITVNKQPTPDDMFFIKSSTLSSLSQQFEITDANILFNEGGIILVRLGSHKP